MAMTNSIVIKTEHLSKQYGSKPVLNDVNLTVHQHSICGFLGPNGAGKSTTIKILLGLSTPTGGRVELFGQDVQQSGLALRHRIGYLAQEPRFYKRMSARETLRFVARFFFDERAAIIEDRVQEMLDLVGLADKADRPVAGFSGGEKQRLGIAQAQINEPELLILDEPAAALDPMGRRDVLDIMTRLRERTTIFYSWL